MLFGEKQSILTPWDKPYILHISRKFDLHPNCAKLKLNLIQLYSEHLRALKQFEIYKKIEIEIMVHISTIFFLQQKVCSVENPEYLKYSLF